MTDINHAGAVRVAVCNAAVDLLDSLAGTIRIYSGSRPDPDGSPTGDQLIAFTLETPAFGPATDDGTNATAPLLGTTISATVAVTGQAGYMAVMDNASQILWTGTVGTVGSGADLELTLLDLEFGQQIDLTSYNYRAPQSG